jgi:hypothetical protein
MEIRAAQQEIRSVYQARTVGQAVSGTMWLISAALLLLFALRCG